MRNVDQKRDWQELTAYKERQVFCSLLALQRQSNFRDLTYWALIETTAYYGWGVRATVVNGSTFWGTTVGRAYRDRKYSELIDGIAAKQNELLSKEEAVSVVWDNH